MTTDLVCAVSDGPDGVKPVFLPEERELALALKARHDGIFWCSRAVGGCGDRVLVVAGPLKRTHFRHCGGSTASCLLASNPEEAVDRYTHLRYQQDLLNWLTGQELQGALERTLPDEGGRADVFVLVDQMSHGIEVQLSGLGLPAWKERDTRYRQHLQCVTWLYGTGQGGEAASASEQAQRGIALTVRRDQASDAVEIGVRGRLSHRWSPLTECKLLRDHFWTPDLDGVLNDDAEWEREQRGRKKEATRPDTRPNVEESRDRPPLPPVPPTNAWPGSFGHWRAVHPEFEGYTAGSEWIGKLEEPERSAARFAAYLVTRIYLNGTISMFDLPDAGSLDQIITTLEAASLIRTFDQSGTPRWARAAHPTDREDSQ